MVTQPPDFCDGQARLPPTDRFAAGGSCQCRGTASCRLKCAAFPYKAIRRRAGHAARCFSAWLLRAEQDVSGDKEAETLTRLLQALAGWCCLRWPSPCSARRRYIR